jgi:SAM-dependent methyltransferase
MHDTAAAFGAAFFRCYADAIEGACILEVGAGDVNGALRGCAPLGSRYTGIDLAAGPGIDIVLNDPYSYPFDSASFDVVVSSSCLEHDPMFWLSFNEMCRVVRPGGFIYLNVPSNGAFHRYPTDNWRFYPDAGLALAAWGRRKGHDIHLFESLIGRRRHDVWNDCVMVFTKGEAPRPLRLLAEMFPRSFNIRIGEEEKIANYTEQTEDMMLRSWLVEKLGDPSNSQGDGKQSSIEGLISALAEREGALTRAEEMAAEREAALADANRRNAELTAKLARAEEMAAERETALADANRRNAELATRLARAEEMAAEHAARSASAETALAAATRRCEELKSALAAAEGEAAGLREECDRALQTAVEFEDIADAAQSAIDTLRARLARSEGEVAERVALAESERDALREERDQIAQERDALREERDQIAQEGDEWFEAAILAAMERLTGGRPLPGWRVGRYRLQIGPVRGKGSAMQRADRARAARRWEQAARFYLEALEQRSPNRPAIWVQLGHALKEAGKTAQAEFAYRRAAQLDRRNTDALVPLGQLLQQQGRDDEAAAVYRRALELVPSAERRAFLCGELAALSSPEE